MNTQYQSTTLDYCAFILSLKSVTVSFPNSFLFCRIIFAIRSFSFPYAFQDQLVFFYQKKKKVFWDLRGTALNPQTYLGKIALVTLLSLSIHKHEVSFYLLRDPLISLSHVLQLPAYKSCPFVRFIPNYLFFVALINRDCY